MGTIADRSENVKLFSKLFLSMFGMTQVGNTIVGNASLRGVSGGESEFVSSSEGLADKAIVGKRVSIMEALAGQAALNSWDNSTRGLDSLTAVNYVKSLRLMANVTHSTNIVTLYQASENVLQQFDKVCVICEGRQIFFGKASEARAYFESLGFEALPNSTTADFLSSIVDMNYQRVKTSVSLCKVPRTPEALEAAFKNSTLHSQLLKEMERYRNGLPSGERWRGC